MTPAVAAALEKLDQALPDIRYHVSLVSPQLLISDPTLVIVDSPRPAVVEALRDLFNAVVAARAGEADEPVKVAGGV